MNRSTLRNGTVRPHGFTVLELLVAIAVVAVVLSLLVVSLSSLRNRGQAALCIANLKQIAAASITYSVDHGGRLPPYNNKGKYWYLFLMHSNLVGRTEGRGPLPNENPDNRKEIKTVYHCPLNEGRIWQYSTPNYTYNRALGDSLTSSVEYPGHTVMFADAGYRPKDHAAYYGSSSPDKNPEKVCAYITDYISASFPWEQTLNFNLHQRRVHIVFVDGHVEALSKDEVRDRGSALTLLWSRENKPINNDQSPNFWSPAAFRMNAAQ